MSPTGDFDWTVRRVLVIEDDAETLERIRAIFAPLHLGGLETLRDGAVWGYGLFAVIVASFFLRYPDAIVKALEGYGRFGAFYAVAAPLVTLVGAYFFGRLPFVPGTTIPILIQKSSDVQVHLAGIVAFTYLGFRRYSNTQLMILFIGLLTMGAFSRGGFLSVFVAVGVLKIGRAHV